MDIDRTASEPATARLTEEITTLAARVAGLDAEIALVESRSRSRLAAYVLAASGLAVLLFVPFLCVGFMIVAYGVFGGFDDSLWWGRLLARHSGGVGPAVALVGAALAVFGGGVLARHNLDNDKQQRADSDTKARLTSERNVALAELSEKRAELEHHRSMVAVKAGNGA